MTDAMEQAEAYLAEQGMLESSGGVLYSAAATLRPGPVYLLGLNPGGSEGADLRSSIANSRAGHNAYLDEAWAPGGHLQPKGQAILQRRVQALCAVLGVETRDMPASNLAFTRSTRLNTHLDFDAAVDLCLPVHVIFLQAIQPKLLMTYGSFDRFRAKFAVSEVESCSARHGAWRAHRGRATVGEQRFAFANIPHMSLWASDQREDVVRWATDGLR